MPRQMQRALIVGGAGFVGRHLFAHLGRDRAIATARVATDAMLGFDAMSDRLADLLARLGPDRAGVTHVFVPFGIVNPELCAREPAATALCNVDAVVRVLGDSLDAGLVPVFVSTDYVYDGTKGLREEREPQCPTTEYGRQKADVERWLQGADAPWLITRLSKVVNGDPAIHGVLGPWITDIRTGARMRSATDQVFSPALVDDVARALADLAGAGYTGIYHVAGPQALSRHALNVLLVDAVRAVDPTVSATVEPCSLREIPFKEQRPLDTSLSTARMRAALPWRFATMAEVCRDAAAAFARA